MDNEMHEANEALNRAIAEVSEALDEGGVKLTRANVVGLLYVFASTGRMVLGNDTMHALLSDMAALYRQPTQGTDLRNWMPANKVVH